MSSGILKAAIVLGVLCVSHPIVLAGSVPDTVKDCGDIFYGDYDPKEPSTLQGFPKSIQDIVSSHLRLRLGDSVYSRLRYDGGQIVNLKKLYKAEPDAREYQWTVPSYLLHFKIQFGPDPNEQYCASISFDAAGKLLEEIALPRTADDPQQVQIISKARALAIASTHEIPTTKASAEIAYAPSCDCLEWLIGFTVETDSAPSGRRILHLNATDPTKYRWTGEIVLD